MACETIKFTKDILTTCGFVKGYQYHGVNIFKNIKYAEAERWHSPQDAKWNGVRTCVSYGYIPPLMHHELPQDDIFTPHEYWVENEDCLNLNLWTPTLLENAKLPVVVAIYGGSFETGSSIEMKAYDGTNLSSDGKLVYVTLNMRINMLGFFNLSCFGDEYSNSGNLGFQDVLCGLKWVKNNIEKFGGDPKNVTLFGTQGGGLRIRYIMQCSAFAGYFSKVFNLSGVADHGAPPKAEEFYQLAKAVLKAGNYSQNDIQSLKEMPLQQLIDLVEETKKIEKIKTRWRCQINDWCTGRPETDGVNEQMRNITVVCGTVFTEQNYPVKNGGERRLTIDEFEKEMIKKYGNNSVSIVSAYKKAFPDADPRDCLYFAYDHRKAVFDYASALSRAGMEVYTYLFNPEFPLNGGTPGFHCSDVSYMLRNTDMVPALNIPGFTKELCSLYSGALINLAHKGTPASIKLNEWRPYTIVDPCSMYFSQNTRLINGEDKELVSLEEKYGKNQKEEDEVCNS